MIVDSSALIAILQNEPERDRLGRAILGSKACCVSAVSIVETGLVAEGKLGENGRNDFDRLLRELDLEVVAFTGEHAAIARDAFRRFGKGKHPARLNFGDCMVYALAKERAEPLLFKGGDFSQTDIKAAAY